MGFPGNGGLRFEDVQFFGPFEASVLDRTASIAAGCVPSSGSDATRRSRVLGVIQGSQSVMDGRSGRKSVVGTVPTF